MFERLAISVLKAIRPKINKPVAKVAGGAYSAGFSCAGIERCLTPCLTPTPTHLAVQLRRAAVLSYLPGSLDIRKLSAALCQKDKIGCATRGGQDRGGLRFSPHFYNTMADVDRTVAALKKSWRLACCADVAKSSFGVLPFGRSLMVMPVLCPGE